MGNNNRKNNNHKSFFFEDYSVSETIFNNENTKIPKVSSNRITFLFFIFSSLIVIFSIKIIYLSLFPEKNFTKTSNNAFIKERADIVDRNGVILARNINVYRAGIKPKFIKDKKKFLINLKLNFPEVDIDNVKKKFAKTIFFIF